MITTADPTAFTDSPAAWVLSLLVSGGLLKYGFDWFREHRKSRREAPTTVEVRRREVDASVLTMARTQDELESFNGIIKETLAEERRQHAAAKADWEAERARYRAEIADLEQRMMSERQRVMREREESDRRYAELQAQLQELRRRHGE